MLLKPEEDVDFIGNKGGFLMHENFEIVILAQGKWNEQDHIRIVNKIPVIKENFDIFLIQNAVSLTLKKHFASILAQAPVQNNQTIEDLILEAIEKLGKLSDEPGLQESEALLAILHKLKSFGNQ